MRESHVNIRLPKGLVFGAVTFGLVLALAEVGRRIYDAVARPEREVGPYSTSLEFPGGMPVMQREKRGALRLVLDPYIAYRNAPGQATGPVTTNARGFRGPDWTLEKPAGTVRVALLGGSLAFGWGATTDDAAVGARLQRRLRAAAPPGRAVEVMNFAVIGHESTQEVIALTTEVLDYAPDLVLALDGWNDLLLAGLAHPAGPIGNPGWLELGEVWARDRQIVGNLLRYSALYREIEKRVTRHRKRAAERAAAAKAARAYGPYAERPDGIVRYRRNLERIALFAKAGGARVVFASQPEMFARRDPVPAAEQDVRKEELDRHGAEYEAYARAIYPAYAAAAAEAARVGGAVHVDCRAIYDAEPGPIFTDWCHVNDRGQDLLARALVPALAAALDLDPVKALAEPPPELRPTPAEAH